jgi:hypothetical protein
MNRTNFEHAAYAVAIQIIVWLLTGDWLAGAMLGVGFFLGREHAQAEYRVIQKFYNGKRANMPWYGGFEPRAWSLDSVLDFMLPIVATLSTLGIINVLMRSIRVS